MVRLGLIGLGYWGPNLLRTFQALPDCRVELIADANRHRLKNFTSFAKATARPEEVFHSDLDGVVVATSAASHFELARAALNSGKHVFVEKPLTTSVEEAEELCRLAEENRKVLMVGHLLLYHPVVRHIKEVIDSGRLGDLYYAYSTRVNLGRIRRDENALWSLCPHDVSVFSYLLGGSPSWVVCTGQVILQQGIEDLVFLTMGFSGGQICHIHASWLEPHKIRKITIVGSRSTMVFDDMEPKEKLRVYDSGVEPTPPFATCPEDFSLRFGEILIPHIPVIEPLHLECRHFIDCIREGKVPLTDGREGLKVVRVLEAATKALKERMVVTL